MQQTAENRKRNAHDKYTDDFIRDIMLLDDATENETAYFDRIKWAEPVAGDRLAPRT